MSQADRERVLVIRQEDDGLGRPYVVAETFRIVAEGECGLGGVIVSRADYSPEYGKAIEAWDGGNDEEFNVCSNRAELLQELDAIEDSMRASLA